MDTFNNNIKMYLLLQPVFEKGKYFTSQEFLFLEKN